MFSIASILIYYFRTVRNVNDLFQVNFTSGRYFSGNAKEASAHLPFDAGFEVTDGPICPF